jgi:3-hydroxybutyryl-CoA dehydratase
MTSNAKDIPPLSLFHVGDVFTCEMIFTHERMEQFSALSGDANPLHLSETHAAKWGFQGRIVFGNLLGVMVSRLVGMELPCRNVLIVKQTLEFRAPAYLNDLVRLDATISSIHEAVSSVLLKLAFSSDERVLVTGQCVVKCL